MPRSAFVPADCPFDFPDVNALGDKLLRVSGPPKFPSWCAEYASTIPAQVCWHCGEKVLPTHGDPKSAAISMQPTSGVLMLGHENCVTKAGARPDELKVSAMATANRESHLPPCRCGDRYQDHYRPITSIFDAYGMDGHGYRPATPFRERGWPHRLIIDYDHEKQTPVYDDEAQQAAA